MLKNFIKKYIFTFYLIIFIIFFITVNKIAKNFLNQTKLEKRGGSEFIEKVYGKENIKDYTKVLSEQSIILSYKPFVEFTETKRSDEFTSVSSSGNRCNQNKILECYAPNGGKKEIWVFGGSTTFGYGVKNDETIPSFIENKMKNNFKVINFGVGHYYSTQERILFNNLLLELPPPYAVIFIDGLNDFNRKYKHNESKYSEITRHKSTKTSEDDIKEYFKERFYRLNIVRLIKESRSKDIETITKEKLNKQNVIQLVKTLINNQKMNESISKKYDIKLINVLQPVPIYEDSYSTSNVPKDFLPSNQNSNDRLKFGYQTYNLNITNKILNLSKLKIEKPMFIDGVHYSPEFNEVIANLITKELISKNGN